MNRKELEKRLIDFSNNVMHLCREARFDDLTMHLAKQVVRSSSSCALNYAEAQSAESRADFAHKISIVLKELRETYVTLQLIESSVTSSKGEKMSALLRENDELIAIFQSSVRTVLGKGRGI
jgi:four helix bundle protein